MEAKKPNYIKSSYCFTFRSLCEKLGIDYDTYKHPNPPLVQTTTLSDGTIGFQLITEEYDNSEID